MKLLALIKKFFSAVHKGNKSDDVEMLIDELRSVMELQGCDPVDIVIMEMSVRPQLKKKGMITMTDEEYELDREELEAPRPLSAERRAEIDELCAQMAADLAEINGYKSMIKADSFPWH